MQPIYKHTSAKYIYSIFIYLFKIFYKKNLKDYQKLSSFLNIYIFDLLNEILILKKVKVIFFNLEYVQKKHFLWVES